MGGTKKIVLKQQYRYLLTVFGVGKILSLTFMLETGPISRFPKVGDYVSYCRKAPSQWSSNGKWKGSGNRNNGNKYLAWAYSEALEFARRLYPEAQAYYQRKMQKTNAAVAHSALANKLSRAGYYVMRDQMPFDPQKVFGEEGGWDGEPDLGVGEKPPCLIGHPLHPEPNGSSISRPPTP